MRWCSRRKTRLGRRGWRLLGVALLYFVVYRGCRYPLLTITTLVVGTLWALGWATITVGHLNILSATFAVMLIGLGDYGVLWVARYDEARRCGEIGRGRTPADGACTLGRASSPRPRRPAWRSSRSCWPTSRRWPSSAGSPAAGCCSAPRVASCSCRRSWCWQERRRAGVAIPQLSDIAGQKTLPFPTPWLPGLAHRPRLALAIGAVLLVVCGTFALRLTYDHNLLNLQARGLDSVRWEHQLIDRAAGATWDAMSIAHTRDEALALKAKYEALPEVGRVVEVASLVPADQDRKLPVVRAIHDKLEPLPPAKNLPAPSGSSPLMVSKLAGRVATLAGSDTALSHAAARLATRSSTSPDPADRLAQFDRRLAADLAAELHQLKSVSRPAPITLDDVPPELRERYVGANGEYLVRAFARDSLWDYAALERFTKPPNTVDPEATGKSFRTLEGLRQMKARLRARRALRPGRDRRRAPARPAPPHRSRCSASSRSRSAWSLTLGVMGHVRSVAEPGEHDRPAADRRRGRRQRRPRPARLPQSRGWPGIIASGPPPAAGVLVAGLTTVLGFGTLITARHAGMASLGLALTLGVTFCMLAALVFLPAMLQLRDLRRLQRSDRG